MSNQFKQVGNDGRQYLPQAGPQRIAAGSPGNYRRPQRKSLTKRLAKLTFGGLSGLGYGLFSAGSSKAACFIHSILQ